MFVYMSLYKEILLSCVQLIVVPVCTAVNQVANVRCGHCHTTLMYPYGAPSVKCAICHYVTNVGVNFETVVCSCHRF